MRISDWSSDVCSSDLPEVGRVVGVDDRVPAGRARRDRLRVVRRVLERQVRIVEPVHRAELVAQVDAGLVVGQVGGKVRRTDGTARRDRVLVTVAQAQLAQAGVAGLETQLAEVDLLVEIGRAACRGMGVSYGSIWVVAGC